MFKNSLTYIMNDLLYIKSGGIKFERLWFDTIYLHLFPFFMWYDVDCKQRHEPIDNEYSYIIFFVRPNYGTVVILQWSFNQNYDFNRVYI
jgi:hypothetical protein